ncbi:Prolyl oligopeptidase family protein [Cryptosporidium felis]|nr:Prolyl oligopeptidase family protein [Cryptosporidium felis]
MEYKDTRTVLLTAIHGSWICRDASIVRIGNQILSFCKGIRSIGNKRGHFDFTLSHTHSNRLSDRDGPLDDQAFPKSLGRPLIEYYKSNYLFSFYEEVEENLETVGIRMVTYSLSAASQVPFGVASNFDSSKPVPHGKILKIEPDNSFDVGLAWKNAYYIAEPKIKYPSWTDKRKDPTRSTEWSISDYGNRNLYVSNWGETLSMHSNPRVFGWSFDMANSINSDPFELDFSFRKTHSVFSLKLLPNEMALIVNALENDPVKLGYSSCIARPSKVILCNLTPVEPIGSFKVKTKSEIVISKEDEYVRGIQVLVPPPTHQCPTRCTVLYFSVPSTDPNTPHWSSMQLCAQDLELVDFSWNLSGERRICVPMQDEPAPANDPLKFKGFAGLFGSSTHKLIPLNGSNWVFTSTYMGSRLVVVAVNVLTGQVCIVKLVVSDEELYFGDLRIFSVEFASDLSTVFATVNLSSPTMPSLTMIIQIDSMSPVGNTIYAQIVKSVSCFGRDSEAFPRSLISKIPSNPFFWSTFKLADTLNNISFFIFKEKHIVVRKMKSTSLPEKSPLLLFLHGGPHSVSSLIFSTGVTFFAELGYTVLLPNFVGSIGFGDNFTRKLIGNILESDLKEIVYLSDSIRGIEELRIDPKKCFAFGGSYGGALVLSLATKFPDFLTSGASINGFSNANSFIAASDVPDYPFSEMITEGHCETGRITILKDYETLVKLHSASPISMVDQVTTPLLLAIGDSDARVPPSQSIEFYNALKKFGKAEVRMLQYPDSGHSISSVAESVDLFLNIANWFGQHSGIPFIFEGDI